MHVARSLFEEGCAVFLGSDFKQIDEKRGRVMIEAASAAGCPSAEADCHYQGWGGFAEDRKMAFAMYRKIAEEAGFAHAEYMVGVCFRYGQGVEQSHEEAVRLWRLAAD